MRLTTEQQDTIHRIASELTDGRGIVRLFGSRLDDTRKGGDVDLLLQLPYEVAEPTLLSAKLAARVSRTMHGRKVDVVVMAPNLDRELIHDIALSEGIVL